MKTARTSVDSDRTMFELKYLKRIENKEYERIENIGHGTNKGEGKVKILYYIHIKINSNEKKKKCDVPNIYVRWSRNGKMIK